MRTTQPQAKGVPKAGGMQRVATYDQAKRYLKWRGFNSSYPPPPL